MSETGIQRFWRLLDTMEFETLPLFSRPHLTWNLRTDYIGRRLIYRPETESTQDDAVRMLDRLHLRSGAILLTELQSVGVGGIDRPWIAPPDLGLQFTLVLFPTPDEARALFYVTQLAIAGAIEDVATTRDLGLVPDLKWPNDVLIDSKKIASCFIDSALTGDGAAVSLVGVGINVDFDPSGHPSVAGPATSLRNEFGISVPREEVLAAFCNRFEPLYEEASSGSQAPFEAWRGRLVDLGRPFERTVAGQLVGGMAVAVGPDGDLIVERADGVRVAVGRSDLARL